MADENSKKIDGRFDYFKERISFAFPKAAGPKMDKVFAADDARFVHLML